MLHTTSYLALIATFFTAGALAGGSTNYNGGGAGRWSNNGAQPPPPQGNVVQLHPNYNGRKCLDVRGAVYANGTPVDIYDCNGTGAQNWVINPGNTKVQVAGQPFCLDAGDWPYDGTPMKIWTCYDNLPAQNWYYTQDQRIALRDRGFCLDLTNGDTCNGNVMQIWACTAYNGNQVWNT